jgi:type I restriction enzyme S subunit
MVNSKVVPIHSVTELVGGGTPPRSQSVFFGGPIPWVTPSDLPPIGNVAELGEVRESLTEAGLKASSAKLLRPPAVLFSSRASIGKIAVATRACATNQGFINFIPDLSCLDPWFLAYYLRFRTPDIIQLSGETTYKEVSRGRMRGFPLLLPPLTEQRRIVARIQECLTRVEEISNLRTVALAELDALLPAYASELEKSANWPQIAVGDLVTSTQNGRSIRSDGDAGNGRVLTLSAVRGPILDFEAAKTIHVDERTARSYSIQQGDVFVSRSNTSELVGLSAVAMRDGATNMIYPDLLIRLKPRLDKVNPLFLAHALRFPSVRKQIRSRAKGTSQSMVKISGAELRQVFVPVPPFAEQEGVVAGIETMRETCAGLSESFDLRPQALVEAVLKKAFAGEL